MASSSVVTLLPGPSRSEDQGIWEEYLKKVTDEDTLLITRWQKILDTLLVYIGLFIGVLTAFIIQVSSMFQPSPEDATNRILMAIYNHTMNASSPIDLQRYIMWGEELDRVITCNAFLLYISLAISITVAALVLITSVWLTRYQRSLTRTGPTIHERIRQRHEAYTGLMEWRLPILIEVLPMVALAALVLFATFISQSLWGAYPAIGLTLANIFVMVALLFVMSAAFAAFIPGAPFHSPLSSFIRLAFQILPNRSIRGLVRIRTICVALISALSLVAIWFFLHPPHVNALLQFLVPVSLLSLCQTTQEEREAQKRLRPPLFCLATVIYSAFIVLAAFSFAIELAPSFTVVAVCSFLRAFSYLVVAVIGIKMSRWSPDEGRAKAEAVTWMISTQPSPHLFQKAIEIAQNSPHLRSTLLEGILPVLDVLIKSIQGGREQDLKDEEKIYFTLLATLVDFQPCKASFWHNEAELKRPVLSDEVKAKLRSLRKGGCAGHSFLPVSGCSVVEAEFVLGKAGERLSLSA